MMIIKRMRRGGIERKEIMVGQLKLKSARLSSEQEAKRNRLHKEAHCMKLHSLYAVMDRLGFFQDDRDHRAGEGREEEGADTGASVAFAAAVPTFFASSLISGRGTSAIAKSLPSWAREVMIISRMLRSGIVLSSISLCNAPAPSFLYIAW